MCRTHLSCTPRLRGCDREIDLLNSRRGQQRTAWNFGGRLIANLVRAKTVNVDATAPSVTRRGRASTHDKGETYQLLKRVGFSIHPRGIDENVAAHPQAVERQSGMRHGDVERIARQLQATEN